MDEHVSWLVADEVAAGLAPAPEHAQTCASCRERLAQATVARAHALQAPEFARRLKKLAEERPEPWWRRRWLLGLGPPLALAATVAVILWVQPFGASPGERLKGGPVLEVRLTQTGQTITRARVGSRVCLALGGAGHRYGLVMAVDEAGRVEQLWPQPPDEGEVPPGAAALVAPDFEVTAGKMFLFAFYGDEPLAAPAVTAELSSAVQRAGVAGQSTLEAQLAPIPGEKARARTMVEVEPGAP